MIFEIKQTYYTRSLVICQKREGFSLSASCPPEDDAIYRCKSARFQKHGFTMIKFLDVKFQTGILLMLTYIVGYIFGA